MKIAAVILEGEHVRLEPLSRASEEALVIAASDGELWNSTVTFVPSRENVGAYVSAALDAQARGAELPFTIIRKSSGHVVGSTRFYSIDPSHRRVEIGYTWLAASAQRTGVNSESKLLLLTHAFEVLGCIRVGFVTDVLNQQSRAAILRLGAKQEGILRNHMVMPDGRYRDSVYFSVTEEEWPKVKLGLQAMLGSAQKPNQSLQPTAPSGRG